MISSPCGVHNCDICDKGAALNCPGCLVGNDYLERRGLPACAIFDCVRHHGVLSCAQCQDPDCRHYRGPDTVCFMLGAISGRRWPPASRETAERQRTGNARHIPEKTIARLRWYLLILEDLNRRGITSISSRDIAARAGGNAALVRKDLSYFGDFGTPSFGYNVRYLQKKIAEILRLNEQKHVVWLGARRLEENQSIFSELKQSNCSIVAVLDIDEKRIGTRVRDLQVLHISSLPQVVANLDIDAAVIALPPEHAQKGLDAVALAGVKAVLNLTPAILDVPKGVSVRNVDIGGELVALSFYCSKENASEKVD